MPARSISAIARSPSPGERFTARQPSAISFVSNPSVFASSAVYFTRELRAERTDGIPQYLEARQMFFQKRFSESVALNDDALSLGVPTLELRAEAVRLRAIALFALGKLPAARWAFQQLGKIHEQHPGLGYGAEAAYWLVRTFFVVRRQSKSRSVARRGGSARRRCPGSASARAGRRPVLSRRRLEPSTPLR